MSLVASCVAADHRLADPVSCDVERPFRRRCRTHVDVADPVPNEAGAFCSLLPDRNLIRSTRGRGCVGGLVLGNSAVVVDLPRWGPMLSPRVPNLVPIPGPRMERETPGQRPRPNYGHPQGAGDSAVVVDLPRLGADAESSCTESRTDSWSQD